MNAENPRRFLVLRVILAAVAVIFVLGLVVVVVGVTLQFQHGRRPTQRVTLANGTVVEYVGAAPGGQTFFSDTPWQARLRKFLPARLQQSLLPVAFAGICGSSSNELVVYFREIRPTSAWTASGLSTEAEDDAGFRYAASGGSCAFGLTTNQQVLGIIVRAYPRRQNTFLLNLRDSRGVLLTAVRIDNTNTGPFPGWHPLPLPQMVTNGAESLTLLSVQSRRYGNNSLYLSPRWDYHSDQPGWSNAQVRYWTCLDATGNEGSTLSPLEPAWKVRAQVMRPNATDFSPAEKFILSNLPVKAANDFEAIDRSNTAAGIGIAVTVLCGPGTFVITNSAADGISRGMNPSIAGRTGTSTSSMGFGTNQVTMLSWGGGTNSFFLVEVANAQPKDEIRFYLQDDQGRNIKINASGWSGNMTGVRTYQPQFSPLPDAKSLTLEVVVDRPKIFDFLIDPKDVKPSNP